MLVRAHRILMAIENCICSLRSIERNMTSFLRIEHVRHDKGNYSNYYTNKYIKHRHVQKNTLKGIFKENNSFQLTTLTW